MTYNEYVEVVTTLFRRYISLTDEEFEEYFAREETIALIKEGYEYFTGNYFEELRASNSPQAVAATLDLLY